MYKRQAVGLSTALGIDVKMTIDDIRKEIIAYVDEGDTRGAVELLGEAKYRICDALVETDGYSFIAVGRPESAGCYCKINSYLKEVISIPVSYTHLYCSRCVMYTKSVVDKCLKYAIIIKLAVLLAMFSQGVCLF